MKHQKREYTITVDNEATKYIGLTIEWDYKSGKVHAYMLGYSGKAMICFGHEKPSKIQNSPPPTKSPNTAQKFNTQKTKMNPPPSTKKRQNMSRW